MRDIYCLSVLQVSDMLPYHMNKSSHPNQKTHSPNHKGMAAELADILSELDEAARLADELDFGVNSGSHRR